MIAFPRLLAAFLPFASVATPGPAPDEWLDAKVEPADLTGVWGARRNFGPEVRGLLTIVRDDGAWTAEIGAFRVPVRREEASVSFALPGERGHFRGRLEGEPAGEGARPEGTTENGAIVGHWIQPRTQHAGLECASPVVLESAGPGRWRGEVRPFEDEFTFFLVAEERSDGTTGAFLRNPDRNWGVFADAERIETDGSEVRLVGRWRGTEETTVLSRGRYSASNDVFSLPLRGATFDFHRIDGDPSSAFFGRGRDPEPWEARVPTALDDGWAVASLEEVGMNERPIRELIHGIVDTPASTVHAPYIHGMLIARHGKLVVEEYFHGFHRDVPHDTRSAAKSLTSFLIGAAIEGGEPVDLGTPVYEAIGAPYYRKDLDPRAKEMVLEHLLTMASGLDCDDRDPDSPGNEEILQSQETNPVWYDYTLGLDMIREPGEQAVYCSVNPNLAGKVLSAATGRSIEDLLREYVAEPLDFGPYHLYLQPTGEPYQGGGSFFLPRDFLKLGQVMLDGGTWNGRRVLPPTFAHDSVQPMIDLRGREYGYLWWIADLPYGSSTVRAFYAGGNGGQVVMGIPELDLVALFFAGNYSDSVMFQIQEDFVPQYILRAVE